MSIRHKHRFVSRFVVCLMRKQHTSTHFSEVTYTPYVVAISLAWCSQNRRFVKGTRRIAIRTIMFISATIAATSILVHVLLLLLLLVPVLLNVRLPNSVTTPIAHRKLNPNQLRKTPKQGGDFCNRTTLPTCRNRPSCRCQIIFGDMLETVEQGWAMVGL